MTTNLKTSLWYVILAITIFNSAHSQTASFVYDIDPLGSSHPNDFVSFQNRIFFIADDGISGDEIWTYNGDTAVLLADILPGSLGAAFELNRYKDHIYFKARDNNNGFELWRCDTSGVSMVFDLNPGSNSSNPANFFEYQGELYFRADEGIHGHELWKFNGDSATLVYDINKQPGSFGSYPREFVHYKGDLYFNADDGIHGQELWKLESDSAVMVQDINPGFGLGSSAPRFMNVLNDTLYFVVNGDNTGEEIWKFDGDTAIEVADINDNPEFMIKLNNELLFTKDEITTGEELWRFDGSNLSMVKDIKQGPNDGGLSDATVYLDKLYFNANDGSNGDEIWVYDGSQAFLLLDLNQGPGGSFPRNMSQVGVEMFFKATDSSGFELWKYNSCDSNDLFIEEIAACDSLEWIDGNTYFYDNYDAYIILTNSYGCDSLITLDLTIDRNIIDTSISFQGNTIISNATNLSYQWLDCNNSFAAIPGENNQVLNVTQNGSYAVKLTQNTCSDTSLCYSFNLVHSSENTLSKTVLFPNPTNSILNIKFDHVPEKMTISQKSLSGAELKKVEISGTDFFQLRLNGEAGLYILELTDIKGNNYFHKISKH
jgi:ELWxxDGT repeat protein